MLHDYLLFLLAGLPGSDVEGAPLAPLAGAIGGAAVGGALVYPEGTNAVALSRPWYSTSATAPAAITNYDIVSPPLRLPSGSTTPTSGKLAVNSCASHILVEGIW